MSLLPLSGLRVLDLSHLLPGPLCTLILADLGAQVLKIERGPTGDLNRQIPPFLHGMSSYFMMLNRNKKSLVLDLKSEAGKKRFLKLVKKSDIVVENFRPGVMKRLGLDYEALSRAHPSLIYCAISGYGQKGPWHEAAGHDLNYIAMTGILEGSSFQRKKRPMLPTQLADIVGGSLLPAISILSALHLRQKTKKGCFIDSAMLPGTMLLMMMISGKVFVTGEELYQENDRMTGKYPNYRIYPTKDKKAMALAAIEPKFWKEFCRVIGKKEFESWIPLTDIPGFPTPSLARCSDHTLKQMKKKLENVFKTKTQKEWIHIFKQEPNCCCTPVLDLKGAISFLRWMGRKELFTLKDAKGRAIPQWLFPFGNPLLSRKKQSFPPRLV